MRVAVTGTPGTGKTTAVDAVETDLDVVPLNEAIRDRELYDEFDAERDSAIVDLDAVRATFADRDDVCFESHLAHHLPVDRVVVLRCRPDVLERRLRERGEPAAKAAENAEAEALDLVLAEAVEERGEDAVYEVDTTDSEPTTVARAIERVVDGHAEPSAGTVSYLGYL